MAYANLNIWIVIPAYNEAGKISAVVREVRESGYQNIVVVDDGSQDNTKQVAQLAGAICLRHRLNRGKGAATKTGIEAAKLQGADTVVTMDGDGQHSAADIKQLIAPIKIGACDVVLGTRCLTPAAMPAHKVLANHIANVITWLFCGVHVRDSQSGMRAFSRLAADLINTRSDKYEYESEVIREMAAHRLRYQEVAIDVRYTPYSMSKPHKQSTLNGIKTVSRMFWGRLN